MIVGRQSWNLTYLWMFAWSGPLNLSARVVLSGGVASPYLNISGVYADSNTTATIYVSYGDGQGWNSSQTVGPNGQSWGAPHYYSAAGNYTLLIGVRDASRSASVFTVLTVLTSPPSGGGNGSGTNGSGGNGSGGNGSGVGNGSGHRVVIFSQNASGSQIFVVAWNSTFVVSADVSLSVNATQRTVDVWNLTASGVVNPAGLRVSYGDGWNVTVNLTANTTASLLPHSYSSPGLYWLSLNASNGNGASAFVGAWLNATFPSPRGTYPAPATVTVAASPVTGAGPLVTTLSAYIDGGSAPFLVVWSVPGSNASGNLTGLMVAVTYAGSGWFPATAFVYNTTNSYGTVLVGEGGVWIFVSASSGNGSAGNGSPNGSAATPISGGKAANLGFTSEAMTAGVAAAVIVGAALGGVAGFLGGRRAGPSRSRGPSTEELVRSIGPGR